MHLAHKAVREQTSHGDLKTRDKCPDRTMINLSGCLQVRHVAVTSHWMKCDEAGATHTGCPHGPRNPVKKGAPKQIRLPTCSFIGRNQDKQACSTSVVLGGEDVPTSQVERGRRGHFAMQTSWGDQRDCRLSNEETRNKEKYTGDTLEVQGEGGRVLCGE